MIELPFLETGKTGYGESRRVFLDMLSLKCLIGIQVQMYARSLNIFTSLE